MPSGWLIELLVFFFAYVNADAEYELKKDFQNRYDDEYKIKSSINFNPIRIKLHYCKSFYDQTTKYNNGHIKNNLKEAVSFFEKTLNVRSITNNILLDRSCSKYFLNNKGVLYCRPFSCKYRKALTDTDYIPADHLKPCKVQHKKKKGGKGVANADLLLYITAKVCGSTNNNNVKQFKIADATNIFSELYYNRVVAGKISICADQLSMNDFSNKDIYITYSLKHEIMHVLGFANHLFGSFVNKNGISIAKRKSRNMQNTDNILKYVKKKWHSSYMFIGKKVVEKARAHFGCNSMIGVEIENSGSQSTAGHHWDSRIMGPELMVGSLVLGVPSLSEISLALLEDTGWYEVDYSMADSFVYGKNKGCDFIEKSCNEYMTNQKKKGYSVRPYCDDASGEDRICSPDFKSVEKCNIRNYAFIPMTKRISKSNMRNNEEFINSQKGGFSDVEFCPLSSAFMVERTGSKPVLASSLCSDQRNKEFFNIDASEYGPTSICASLQNISAALSTLQYRYMAKQLTSYSTCYKAECRDQVLVITIEKYVLLCNITGERIFVNLTKISAYLVCPSLEVLCNKKKILSMTAKYYPIMIGVGLGVLVILTFPLVYFCARNKSMFKLYRDPQPYNLFDLETPLDDIVKDL